MATRLPLFVILLANLVFSPTAADEPKRPRGDRPGGTLPPGAIARLPLWVTADGTEGSFENLPQGGTVRCHLLEDGVTLVTQCGKRDLVTHDLATGREIRRFPMPHDSHVFGVTGDGKQAIISDRSLLLDTQLLALPTGKTIRLLAPELNTGLVLYQSQQSCLLPGGKAVVIWGITSGGLGPPGIIVTLIDTATGKELRRLGWFHGTHAGPATVCAVRPMLALPIVDSKYGESPRVIVWDLETGKEVCEIKPAEGKASGADFTPDARFLAVWGDRTRSPKGLAQGSGTLELWEFARRRVASARKTPGTDLKSVAFRGDGRILAAGQDNGEVVLWDMVTGAECRRLKGHRAAVQSLRFSGDGRRLVSGATDRTALIWDVADLLAAPRPAGPALPGARLDALWTDLAADDAAQAYRAVIDLAAAPEQAVPLLYRKLAPVAPVVPERLQQLLADLDAPKFATRQRACRDLAHIGRPAVPALKEALKGDLTLEVRRRIEELLPEIGKTVCPPDGLRQSRALLALEYMSDPAARQHLDRLASGAPLAWLTEQAQAALARKGKP